MKICGIIVEYNPLHNGHLYHIEKTKEASQCDLLIACMSGNFVQRGEVAIINKHIRTEMALKMGVDIVVELPYLYAVGNADLFAFGAITILNALNVNEIYFGSESNNPEELKKMAKTLETAQFDETIKTFLDQGYSYAKASELALNDLNIDLVLNSNDILGVQYIKNILKINPNIAFHTIERIHSSYNDTSFHHESIASATSIREALKHGKDIKNYVPQVTYDFLKNHTPISWDMFYHKLQYQVISNQLHLKNIHDVNEGIENKIIKNILKYPTFSEFRDSLVSKRYTKAKIQRLLCHILNNITKTEVIDEELSIGPKYIRILGVNKNKTSHLQSIKKDCSLAIITNVNKHQYHLLKVDQKVSEVYHLVDKEKERKIPIILEINS